MGASFAELPGPSAQGALQAHGATPPALPHRTGGRIQRTRQRRPGGVPSAQRDGGRPGGVALPHLPQ
eukprot:753370-Prorocentrum_minimum.AAC.1